MSTWKEKLALSMGGAAAATAIAFTGAHEGLSLQPYWDKIGHVTTYCYGETSKDQLKPHYTTAECDDMLAAELLVRYQGIVKCAPEVETLTAGEKVAYLDLAYNAGTATFCNYSLPKLLRAGRQVEACERLKAYSYSRGTWIQGLFNRRVDTTELCMKDLKP